MLGPNTFKGNQRTLKQSYFAVSAAALLETKPG